jgi:very-short-patch-repair endonuclease
MPRTFIRNERKRDETRDYKVYAPWWVDPYWFILGSSIEKMVMAELARRGIYFIYRNQTNDLGGFVDPTWEADFFLPQHKIWIEVQGSYFHSLPGAIEADSLRYAAIKMAGWTPLFWWEFDIRNRLSDLMNETPELYTVTTSKEDSAREKYGTEDVPKLRFKVGSLSDQLVGLRKALAGRATPSDDLVFRRKKPGDRSPK